MTANAYVLTDATTSSGSFTNASSTTFGDPGTNIYNWIDGNRGAAVTIGIPNAIDAGDHLSLVVTSVVNPAAGSDNLSVSTSTDSESSTSGTYTVSSAAQVSQPSVSLSSNAAQATGVIYTVGFKPSSAGAFPPGEASQWSLLLGRCFHRELVLTSSLTRPIHQAASLAPVTSP